MAQAIRPAFICIDNKLYQEYYTFEFFAGFSLSQKRKTIDSFHNVIKSRGIINILEVSRKNENELGVKLSAFNLKININNTKYPVECIYQASKVFNDLKFTECLDMYPGDAKKYVKGKAEDLNLFLSGFNCFGKEFPLEPKSLFYDYLYVIALSQNEELSKQIIQYDCFTDIEFNHKKQYASQARSCALYKYLFLNKCVNDFINNPMAYVSLYETLQDVTLV